jgi:hypothetical protein
MDVILDSNVYVSDYRMESIAFKNLFDYLRRTGASLVLLRIVREEVVAKFGRDLTFRGNKVAEAWKGYRTLHFPQKLDEFMKPDVANQRKLLRQRLMKPSKAVKVIYHADTTRISVDEVFIRGIHRRPPANANGEELRDVIVWLSSLDYAKTTNRAIAFITDDAGFWVDNDVRPEIQRDIKKVEVEIRLYRNIYRFVEQNSPEARPVEDKWAYEIFPEFGDDVIATADSAIRSRRVFGPIKSVSVKSVLFKEGKLYEVAPDVQFAELQFAVNIEFETRTVTNPVSLGGFAAVLAGAVNPSPANAFLTSAGWGRVLPTYRSEMISGPAVPGFLNWAAPQVQPSVDEGQYLMSGTVRASARLLKGNISDKEVSDFQIEKIGRTDDLPAESSFSK